MKPKKEIKPGMLCVVSGARHTTEVNGRFVTVIRPAMINEKFIDVNGDSTFFAPLAPQLKAWVISSSSPLPWRSSFGTLRYYKERAVGEPFLIPIEDNEGEDEMISIAGKPQSASLDKPKEIA